jgi:hypothetical protein
MYSVLDTPDQGTSCPMRKANKKLREIEKLKLKSKKTPEEYAKIREEDVWKAIVEPIIISNERPQEVRSKKKMQRDKDKIKELERRLCREKEKHIRSTEKIELKLREQEQEYNRRILQLQNIEITLREELKRLKSSKASYVKKSDFNPENDLEEKVMDELYELTSNLGNNRKALKQLLLKYHPDKNQNSVISLKITKILNDIQL